jgi:DedD protein
VENSLKQRLVGAIVLIALAVIFLPSLLKEKENQAPFISKIPTKPNSLNQQTSSESEQTNNQQTQNALSELDSKIKQQHTISTKNNQKTVTKTAAIGEVVVKDNQAQADGIESAEPLEQSQSGKTNSDTSQPNQSNLSKSQIVKSKKMINSDFKDAAWVIQVASFSSAENAKTFSEKLQKQGHKAYARIIKTQQNKTFYRVNVGPYINKEDATRALPQVNKDSGMKGLVRVFDPVNP